MEKIEQKIWFNACLKNKKLVEKLKNIKLVLSDVDGALTNGGIYISDHEDGRTFSVVDGFIVEHLIKNDIKLVMISGKEHISTIVRGELLNIPKEYLIVGKVDKREAIKNLQAKVGIGDKEIIIFGDDFSELQLKNERPEALFASPQSALFYVTENADVVVPVPAGFGSFRLLMDLLLYVKGVHFAQEFITKALQE